MYLSRWYTNHGPKAKTFENEVARYCDVNYSIAVSSDILATVIALTGVVEKSINLDGNAPENIVHALKIAMIDSFLLHVALENNSIISILDDIESTQPILLCEAKEFFITAVKQNNVDIKNVPVIIYSNSSFQFQARRDFLLPDNWIRICPLDSWLEAKGCLTGAIIMTNKKKWADIFRNIRSSYGVIKPVDVKATCNGRFSELQAGLAHIAFNKVLKKCCNKVYNS